MKYIAFLLAPVCCFAQSNYSYRDLKAGRYVEDTSYVYTLPFQKGKRVFVVQGYESNMSHKGEVSLDFKVRKGTAICAAREGIVVATRDDSNKGGLKPANLSDGNYICILHSDGSKGYYWHLQKNGVEVKMGDTIQRGQVIGFSGNTGYSAFPHLHFEVQGYDDKGRYRQLPTRFQTKRGIRYLKPLHFYKR